MKLHPDLVYDKIEDIDLSYIKNMGIKGVILDIDNTLVVPHTHADDRAIAFVNKVKSEGLKACIVSNNIYERAESFAKEVDLDFVCDGNKPSRRPFLLALDKLGLNSNEVAVIGDQIFTDVWGGNRMKMLTILVSPICDIENYFIKLKRMCEKIIMIGFKGERNG